MVTCCFGYSFFGVTGNIQMNAPRKSVGRREEEQKWGFSRISSGGSFLVLGVPADPHPDVFPPCKIIDLEAVKSEEEVTLSWTAPGEDFDRSHQNTWPTLRTKIGTSLPCARISSEAKQIKKIDFYQSRVRNSICLMLWDLDKCCFLKKNPTVFTYLLRLLCIGHKDAKRLWTVWRHCASLVQVAPLCGKEAVSSGRLYHHSSLEEEKPGVSGRTPAGRLLRWIHRMVLEG